MPKYDVTLKRLSDEFAEDYIRFALGLERFSVEVLDVEAVDKELPLLLREVDFAAKVKVEEEDGKWRERTSSRESFQGFTRFCP